MKIVIAATLFFFTGMNTIGQQAFRNTGNLQVHSGGSLAGFGDFTNSSTATLVNNGSLYVKGNLTNDQSGMSAGTGTLYLNGSSAQSLNGTQTYYSYHLNSNNSSGITLNIDLSVSGTHTFSAGNITTSATPNYLIYQSGASYTGDGDSKHVNGWVKKIGSSNFVFPVGDASYERTIQLSSLSTSGEFAAKYYTTTANTAYSYMTLPLVNVDPSEYWAINKVSGGSATVTLNWDASKVYFPNWIISDLVVAGWNGSKWVSQGIAGTATGTAASTGTIGSNSISSFDLFTPGSTSWILSQDLLNFGAYRKGELTAIEWTTEQEQNIDNYQVERSDDAIHFYRISQWTARNSGTEEEYETVDPAPIHGEAYYRLRSISVDGTAKLSRVVRVEQTDKKGELRLLTNPVLYHKAFLVAGGQISGAFRYSVLSMGGQLLQQGNLNIRPGSTQALSLDDRIPAGSYLLAVYNEHQNFEYKILVR